jgi:hypothetical protein
MSNIVPEDICCKCKKYRIENKRYQLCRFCNFERRNPGQNIYQVRLNKSKSNQESRLAKMQQSLLKDPVLHRDVCSIPGCLTKQYTKNYGGLCFEHYHIQKRNILFKKNNNKGRPSKMSDKQKVIKKEMSIIKKEEKIKHGTECEGCKKHFQALDYSHILSVKQRSDLELVRENKNLLCRSCHEKWESWDMSQMFTLACITYNLNYIRKMDEQTFWRIYFKCIDHLMFTEAKIMEQIDEDFKNENI